MSVSEPARRSPVEGRFWWAAPGDINAFFGLMLDNIGVMILVAGLLVSAYHFPPSFVMTRMVPGTAVGVLIGDLIYTGLAIRLARRSGRRDVTAMPLGLDTPSAFGTVFLVLGPAFQAASRRGLDPQAAAHHAWSVRVFVLLASGLFKLGCALVSGAVRRAVPRAGLLGSLTAIALVIISFLPLLEIVAYPVTGMVALVLILATLTAGWELPFRVPGALAALVVGCAVYYGMNAAGLGGVGEAGGVGPIRLRFAFPWTFVDWLPWLGSSWREGLGYLPVAIPLALATVVGGIDCTESAAAAGDSYPTGQVIAVEGISTLVGGLCGGVIQSTPYIGQPAYKAMGARAGYTLATALFVGAAGIFGFFEWIFHLVPKSTVFPILIFVGLEITAQSFRATPRRHYPAVALACVPVLAYLALNPATQVLDEAGKPFEQYGPQVQHLIQTLTMLSGGFIITSLLWATFLVHLIDGRCRAAAATLLLAGLLAWVGVIHSPLPSSPILLPGQAVEGLRKMGRLKASVGQTPTYWAAAYGLAAVMLLVLGRVGRLPISSARDNHGDARGV